MDGEQFNGALLALLGRTEGAAAERVLMQVLQAASGPLQHVAMRELLARRGTRGAAAVARELPTLNEGALAVLSADLSLLEPVARTALRDDSDAIRLLALDLLARTHRASTAYLLVGAMNDPSQQVKARAAAAVLDLLRRHRGDLAAMREHLIPAVTAGARNLTASRSAESLKATILLGRWCDRDVLRQLDQPGSRLTELFSRVLRDLQADEAAEFVMLALPYVHAGSVSRSYISQASWSALASVGVCDWYRLVKPVASALTEIHHLRAVAEDPHGLTDLDTDEQARALRLVLACGISPNLKRTLVGEALTCDRPAAMVAANHGLTGPDCAPEIVLMALHCRHEDVQAAAAARVLAVGVDANLTQHLLKSLPDFSEPVRVVVGQFLAARSFDTFWQSYSRLGSEVRTAAGRALLKLDDHVADLLAGRLAGRDVNEQMQAIQMVRQLAMVDHYGLQLSRMARQGDRRVRSACVAALGMVQQYDARSTLARCLDDDDMRVQANAVEALARAGCEPSAVLDKLDSPSNRVRGNAIKWLLETAHPQGGMALAEMLVDPRTAHRISATWVVKALAYKPAAALIRRLAMTDPDTKVRARMATTAMLLGAPMLEEAPL